VAFIDSDLQTRRIDVDSGLSGGYAQVAIKLPHNTILRLSGEQTAFNRVGPGFISTVTMPSNGDPRNKLGLRYLLATDEIGATNPVTGAPYPSGAIDNGLVNWANVDSYQGELSSDGTINSLAILSLETEWSPWLSTQFAAGYDSYFDDNSNVGFNFYAPGASGNNLPGWTEAATPADTQSTNRTKVMRFSVLATNDLFGGRVHSQTIIGADYARSDNSHISYAYEEADSSFNPIITPGVTANDGRTVIPKQEWSVDDGPALYPLFWRQTPRVTIGGVNYVRELANPINPALISPADPLGTSLTSGNYQIGKLIDKGIYGVSYTQWFHDRLDVLAGFRLAQYFNDQLLQSKPFQYLTASNAVGYNLGVDYQLTSWLHPYATVSDSFTPPLSGNQFDPFGQPPKTTHGIGEEVGLKIANPSNTVSGSIAIYHARDKNDLYPLSPTISNDINPSGLNGGGGGSYINVNRETEGLQVTLTAAPTPNWRMRLSAAATDGTIGTSIAFNEVYNDQFFENSQGQVTYKDGTVVYVPAAFNAKAPVVPAGTAGAAPLTAAMMSTPTSPYFANPNTSGQISATSNAATVLEVVDPTHGPILTGATLLPISDYQLIPSLDGVTPPGYVVASAAGDKTTGYPEYSLNYTSVYTFSHGWLRGIRVGGTASVSWKIRDYYWYPEGIVYSPQSPAPRIPFYLPTQTQFNLILGYSRRFRRVTFNTQLNISNLLNHYEVEFLPNEQLGYTSASSLTATFSAQPRAYVWTNTISF
jgi:outer membrane receptor protein involved in Fe transport